MQSVQAKKKTNGYDALSNNPPPPPPPPKKNKKTKKKQIPLIWLGILQNLFHRR